MRLKVSQIGNSGSMRNKWPQLTGIALGICVALLIISILVAMYGFELAYFLPGPWGLVLLAVIIWLAVLGALVVREGYIPALPLWGVLLAVLVGWPLCASGPIAARMTWMMWHELSEVPTMPQAQGISVFADDPGEGPLVACLKYGTTTSAQAVFEFYRKQLPLQGWSEDFLFAQKASSAIGITSFHKNGKTLSITYDNNDNDVSACLSH
jgi:hypothetical protein